MKARAFYCLILSILSVFVAGFALAAAPVDVTEDLQPADVYIERLRESLDSIQTLSADFIVKTTGPCKMHGDGQSVEREQECALRMKGNDFFLSQYEFKPSKQRQATAVYGGKVRHADYGRFRTETR